MLKRGVLILKWSKSQILQIPYCTPISCVLELPLQMDAVLSCKIEHRVTVVYKALLNELVDKNLLHVPSLSFGMTFFHY